MRQEHLQLSNWTSRGYNQHDSTTFLTAYSATLQQTNAVFQLTTTNSVQYM